MRLRCECGQPLYFERMVRYAVVAKCAGAKGCAKEYRGDEYEGVNICECGRLRGEDKLCARCAREEDKR